MEELRKLNPFAVTFRYGDEDITRISVMRILRAACVSNVFVEESLISIGKEWTIWFSSGDFELVCYRPAEP